MSKHLSDARIAEIVSVIDGWRGKLTWQLLIDALEPRMGRYSRVALSNHTRIADAFRARKSAIGGREEGAVEGKTKEIQMLLGRIDRLKSENERLERENQAFLEQFARWAYNAYNSGISQEELNKTLPKIDRGATQ